MPAMLRPEVTNMAHAFECGDVIPGCAAVFEADTEGKLVAEVGEHARAVHGIERDRRRHAGGRPIEDPPDLTDNRVSTRAQSVAWRVHIGMWRSLVARLLWEQEAGSSNLPIPTTKAQRNGYSVYYSRSLHPRLPWTR